MASASRSLPQVVFVLGGPGAGKGTQCAKIVDTFDFVHLSAGDLLRAEQATPGSEYGEMIKRMIESGAIVPAKVTIMLLKKAMEASGRTRFLIDGFPRNKDNNDEWHALMSEHALVKFLLFLDCPEEEMERRIMLRAAGSGRIDDNITSLRKRFVTYREQTMPVIASYEDAGLVRKVDATRDIDTVFSDLHKLFLQEFGPGAVRASQ